ncbi:MAG TPA: hypothetical protein VJT75_15655 [Thermoleophilaceae bacterium]|nr:hypothetical protein [Thermoleophilaceae bacterium]
MVAAAAVLMLAPPGAAGAATWSPPERVTGSMSGPTCCPGFGFSDAGNGLAVFTTQSIESHTSGALTGTWYVRRNAAGDWSFRVLQPGHPEAFRTLEQRVTADGRVLVFGTRVRFRPYRDRPTGLALRRGRLTDTGLKVDSTELLRKGAPPSYDFAANESGDAVVAWAVKKGKHRGVFVRRASGGGEFGDVVRLAERFGRVQVAVGRNGHAVVAWARGTRLYARIAARGGGFGERLGLGHDGTLHALAAGPSGQILMARVRPPISRAKLIATITGPGGNPSEVHVLSGPDRNLYVAPPLALFDRAGRGLVAWTDQGTHVATLNGGDPRIEPIQPAGVVRDMAVGPAGGVALALSAGDALYVASRGRAGDFAPAELAAPAGDPIDGAAVAFDPLTAQPNVLHLRYVGEGEPIDEAYVVAREPG